MANYCLKDWRLLPTFACVLNRRETRFYGASPGLILLETFLPYQPPQLPHTGTILNYWSMESAVKWTAWRQRWWYLPTTLAVSWYLALNVYIHTISSACHMSLQLHGQHDHDMFVKHPHSSLNYSVASPSTAEWKPMAWHVAKVFVFIDRIQSLVPACVGLVKATIGPSPGRYRMFAEYNSNHQVVMFS